MGDDKQTKPQQIYCTVKYMGASNRELTEKAVLSVAGKGEEGPIHEKQC